MQTGEAADGAGPLQPLHRHADARLILFVAGRYRERAFDESATFAAGDFVIRPSFYAHDGRSLGRDARYVHMRLRPETARKFFAAHGWRARRGRCASDMQDILAALHDPNTGDAVLAGASHTLPSPTEPSPFGAIARALCDVDSPRLGDLAESRGVPPWELTRQFARAFGMCPNRYRQQARVQSAIRLMAETQSPLAAIAAQAGFADQSHLGRALRAITGCTPDQLRRQVAV